MFCCFLCCCKQKASKYCMGFNSMLLFLSGAFTIYVSVCLFLNVELLGGILKNANGPSSGDIQNKQVYLNSYIHMFIFVSGVLGLIMSLLGCCTSRVSDRCCLSCFTVVLIIFCLVFNIAGIIMVSIHLQTHDYVSNFCSNDSFSGLQAN